MMTVMSSRGDEDDVDYLLPKVINMLRNMTTVTATLQMMAMVMTPVIVLLLMRY